MDRSYTSQKVNIGCVSAINTLNNIGKHKNGNNSVEPDQTNYFQKLTF